jgi:hypothetical protein
MRHVAQRKISHERLKQVLDYHLESGIFRWKIRKSWMAKPGSIAGTRKAFGHISIVIDGRPYLAHHLAWFYVHGVWPNVEIDHRDTMPWNNAIDNLRRATRGQNAANTNRRRDNTTGFKGVSLRRGSVGYQAKITINKKQIHLGYFPTAEEAHEVYKRAATEHFGAFARTG